MSKILVIDGNYHFGDNAGVFQNAAYIGHHLSFPLRKTWAQGSDVAFIFTTHDIETWGNWAGHKVSVNGHEVGRLKDDSTPNELNEEIKVTIPSADFEGYLNGNDNFSLSIELDSQTASPGMADDFVLTRIETENLAVAIGWK